MLELGWEELGSALPAPPMLGSLSPGGGLGVEPVEPAPMGSGEGSFCRHPADPPPQVHQPAARHPGHAASEPQRGPGGAAPPGRPQRLAPATARAGWALGGRPQGAGRGTGPRRRHPVQVRPKRGWGMGMGGGEGEGRARLTTLPAAQGGGARPGGRHGARAAAALPLPRALPAQLRAARQRARSAAARRAALRRLRLRAARDGDCAAGAARASHGECGGRGRGRAGGGAHS